ncbi:hypothetical protein [Gimesia sp.]|uniref:hypothetical protein n=1 Tax=Gimesia sp. TaxID=2024833 RepID=UPI003A8F557C
MLDGNESKSRETNNRLWQSFKSVSMVLVAYILSFGPVFSTTYVFFGLLGCEPVLKVYSPVIWLAETTNLDSVLDSYALMWLWLWGLVITF